MLFALNTLNFYDRGVISAVTEPVRLEFSLSDTQIGLLTTAFTLLFAVIGMPLARLADRGSRKKLLVGGVSVWSLMTATAAIAGSFGMLLFSRLGVAVGEAAYAPAATSWLGDLFPPEKRSRAMALFTLGVPVGVSLSFLLSGPLAQAFGWRTAMALAAAPALLAVPALLTLKEPVRGAADRIAAKAPLGRVLRIRTLWWIIASGALLNFAMYAFSVFLASFLIRVHGASLRSAGIAAGLLYGIGGITGGVVAGRIGDRMIRIRKDGRMLAASLAALIAAPLGVAAMLTPSVALAVPLLGITCCLLTMYYPLVYSAMHDIVPPSQRSTAMAFYMMMMYLCGASFGPLITGNLSDRMARRAAAAAGSPAITEAFRAIGLQQAMLIVPALAVVLSLVLYAGSRTIGKDMETLRTF